MSVQVEQRSVTRAPLVIQAVMLLLLVTTGLAMAQRPDVAGEPFWRLPASVTAGFEFRRWTITEPDGTSKLTQFAYPVYLQSHLGTNLDYSCLFNLAASSLDYGSGASNELNGMTDGKLSLTLYLPDPRFSMGLGLRLPTGESKLDAEQDNVAQVLIDRMLGFHVKRYGEGMDVELRAGYAAAQSPELALAAGAAYQLKGGFDVREQSGGGFATYEPGNELSVFGAAHLQLGERQLDASIRYLTFAVDRRDGRDELDEGRQLMLTGDASQELMHGLLAVGADLVFKDDTVIFGDGEELAPIRDVAGNIIRFRGAFDGRLNQATTLGGAVSVAWFGETDAGTGDGFLFEGGPHLVRTLAPGLALRARWLLLSGNAEQNSIDLSGQAISLGIALGGSR